MDKHNLEVAIRAAFQAGFNEAQDGACVSEHNGWHRVDPYIEWNTKRAVDVVNRLVAEELHRVFGD